MEPMIPRTRKETLLAAINGQDVEQLIPVTDEETFLAKIGGQDVELPVPKTRVDEFLQAIIDGGGGGGDITLTTLNVSANGTTNAPSGTAYNKVVASVSNSYAAGDEGKVVQNGALVSQTSDTATSNGTVDTTLINSLTVAVPGPSGTKQITISQNGTTTENVSGYANAEIIASVAATVGKASQYLEVTPASTASSSNQLTIQLTPVSSGNHYWLAVWAKEFPAVSEEQTPALLAIKTDMASGSMCSILRANGTIGSDQNEISFASASGVLTVGGQYGVFPAGATYCILLVEV